MRILVIIGFCILSAISQAEEIEIPEGFVLQVLEPTGGKILRPKDWFYSENPGSKSFLWTLSKEDSAKGPYDTGVRIQVFVGVEENTGKSPKQFVLDFVEQKKKEAKKVFGERKPVDQGMFTRIGLETEEGPFRILYSLFWGNQVDIVAVSIAGAKIEDWEKYSSTFDKMSAFELIDMKRFGKSK